MSLRQADSHEGLATTAFPYRLKRLLRLTRKRLCAEKSTRVKRNGQPSHAAQCRTHSTSVDSLCTGTPCAKLPLTTLRPFWGLFRITTHMHVELQPGLDYHVEAKLEIVGRFNGRNALAL